MKSILLFSIPFCLMLASCGNNQQKKTLTSQLGEDIEELTVLSDTYYLKDNFEKALPLFDKIIALDSTRGEAYYRRGYCKAQRFDYDGSTLDYMKSIELNYRKEDSYFSIGCNYAALLNDSLAFKFFMKSYELNPFNENAKREVSRFKKRLSVVEI